MSVVWLVHSKTINLLSSKQLYCSSGCMFKVIVPLEGEPFACYQVYFLDCPVLNFTSDKLAWCCHYVLYYMRSVQNKVSVYKSYKFVDIFSPVTIHFVAASLMNVLFFTKHISLVGWPCIDGVRYGLVRCSLAPQLSSYHYFLKLSSVILFCTQMFIKPPKTAVYSFWGQHSVVRFVRLVLVTTSSRLVKFSSNKSSSITRISFMFF